MSDPNTIYVVENPEGDVCDTSKQVHTSNPTSIIALIFAISGFLFVWMGGFYILFNLIGVLFSVHGIIGSNYCINKKGYSISCVCLIINIVYTIIALFTSNII